MKNLNLRNRAYFYWSLFCLVVLGTTLLPQVQTGLSAQIISKTDRAPQCSAQKLAEVRAHGPEVHIDCSLTLKPNDVITKRLIFEGPKASWVTVDCNGATIDGSNGGFYNPYNQDNPNHVQVEIRSLRYWDSEANAERGRPPQNITLRNCQINGSVSIYSITGVDTSRRRDHVQIMRSIAPRDILFDHVTINGIGGNAALLYLFSGVSNFQMRDSEIKGSTGTGVNIYLDAESYGNTFRNNSIHATTARRELMSIDGSAYNTIINNHFSALNHGGIYLYRNCGEGGTIRHSTPSNNTIVNNVFYYKNYDDDDHPAILFGARNGQPGGESYECNADAGYPFGSSASDYDHAQFNVVMQNQIFRPQSVSDMIKVRHPFILLPNRFPYFPPEIQNAPNYIKYNDTVSAEIERAAGCYISDGYQKDFILDGQFINLFRGPNGEPVCRGYRLTCNDGVLSRSSDSTCQ